MFPSIIVVRCFISNPYDDGSRSGHGPFVSVSLLKYLKELFDFPEVTLAAVGFGVRAVSGLLIVTLSAFCMGTFTVLHAPSRPARRINATVGLLIFHLLFSIDNNIFLNFRTFLDSQDCSLSFQGTIRISGLRY